MQSVTKIANCSSFVSRCKLVPNVDPGIAQEVDRPCYSQSQQEHSLAVAVTQVGEIRGPFPVLGILECKESREPFANCSASTWNLATSPESDRARPMQLTSTGTWRRGEVGWVARLATRPAVGDSKKSLGGVEHG